MKVQVTSALQVDEPPHSSNLCAVLLPCAATAVCSVAESCAPEIPVGSVPLKENLSFHTYVSQSSN